MTEGLKILYNTKLKQIRYSKQEVIVQSPMHKFKGKSHGSDYRPNTQIMWEVKSGVLAYSSP